jgi:hypothetical protein
MEGGDMAADSEWERYGGALVRAMREVLVETPEDQHPVLLETADYWLSVGLAVSVQRPDDAARLLELIEAHEGNRAELAEDAAALCEEILR